MEFIPLLHTLSKYYIFGVMCSGSMFATLYRCGFFGIDKFSGGIRWKWLFGCFMSNVVGGTCVLGTLRNYDQSKDHRKTLCVPYRTLEPSKRMRKTHNEN